MNMKFPFEVNRQTRKNTLFYLDNLDEDKINMIPAGFKNNIAWNLGHILVTHQLLFYGNSGQDITVSKEWIEKYRKGSTPSERVTMEEFEEIKSMFVGSIDREEEDYNNGLFKNYTAYQTSYGIAINDIEDLIRFIYAHDAFHWGIIVALKKLV